MRSDSCKTFSELGLKDLTQVKIVLCDFNNPNPKEWVSKIWRQFRDWQMLAIVEGSNEKKFMCMSVRGDEWDEDSI